MFILLSKEKTFNGGMVEFQSCDRAQPILWELCVWGSPAELFYLKGTWPSTFSWALG